MIKMTNWTRRYALSIIFLCCLWPASALAINNCECLECHGDKSLTKESTDNILQTPITESLYVDVKQFDASVHNVNGVTCVDCHSDIEKLNYNEDVPHKKNLKPVYCSTCHDEIGSAFKNSVHMKIRNKGITMTCYACHGYHYVKRMEGASVAERDNSSCLKCHNPYQYHDWLPAKDSHFTFVECIVCHAPAVPRHLNLRLYDLVTNKFITGDEFIKTLGITYDEFMPMLDKNKDGIINLDEFERLILILRQKNIRAIFHAELEADLDPIAHDVNRSTAQKTCTKCHSINSPYFNAVSIIFTKKDGSVERYKVDRDVLESYALNHFYILRGTRVKVLDKIGILLLLGGACAALGHFIVRVLTIPLRRKKEQDDN